MKRTVAVILIIFLLLQTCSCIQIVDSGFHPELEKTESVTQTSVFVPTFSTLPDYPAWSNVSANVKAFLALENAVIDVSKREYSYAEMREDLATLKEYYPTLMDYYSFGKSVAGRELYVARIGNVDRKSVV